MFEINTILWDLFNSSKMDIKFVAWIFKWTSYIGFRNSPSFPIYDWCPFRTQVGDISSVMYMLQCIGVFGELEEYNAIRKKDADIIKKKKLGLSDHSEPAGIQHIKYEISIQNYFTGLTLEPYHWKRVVLVLMWLCRDFTTLPQLKNPQNKRKPSSNSADWSHAIYGLCTV